MKKEIIDPEAANPLLDPEPHEEDAAPMRGVAYGLLFSVPIWALILLLIFLWVRAT